MKALALSFVWWIGIDQDFENLPKYCTVCVNLKNIPTRKNIHHC